MARCITNSLPSMIKKSNIEIFFLSPYDVSLCSVALSCEPNNNLHCQAMEIQSNKLFQGEKKT